jgi:ankyrin repeat protein
LTIFLSQDGNSALMLAISEGHVDVVKLLLEARAKIETQVKV